MAKTDTTNHVYIHRGVLSQHVNYLTRALAMVKKNDARCDDDAERKRITINILTDALADLEKALEQYA
jgi:hypothetical protein